MTEIYSAVLPMLARAKMLNIKQVGRGDSWLAHGRGAERERAFRIMKAAVPAGTTTSGNWAADLTGDYNLSRTAFFDSLRTRSLFFRMLADGIGNKVPWRTRIFVTATGATAWIVGEGKPTPLSQLELSRPALLPIKAAAMIVASAEMVESTSGEAEALFNRELRGAVSDVVDAKFLEEINDFSATLTSNGNDAVDARQDVLDLLMQVNSLNARLIIAAAADVAKRASTLATTGGAACFPDMSPTGGEMCGVPVVVSSAVAAGTMHLIDGSGILMNAGDIDFSPSREADVEMLNSALQQDGTTGTGASMVSLFQANAVALKVVVDFAVERMRADAVATMGSIAWTNAS